MKTILITGLDGSGKSTILDKIKPNEESKSVEIINLPELRLDNLKKDEILYQTAKFVNDLNWQANEYKMTQLKAIALMTAMFLYKKLEQKARQKGIKHLVCERHPLIDTGIYAMFYAKKMVKGSIKKEKIRELDAQYAAELNFINEIAPKSLQLQFSLNSIDGIREFIYQKFAVELEETENNIASFFDLNFPDEIYFLNAEAEILFNRIQNRKQSEAHEQLLILEKLNKLYLNKFKKLEKDKKIKIEYINAENFEALDSFAQKLNNTLI